MATLEELQTRLERLRDARGHEESEVESGEFRVKYRSDAELATAIADLERQIAAASGTRIHTVRFSASKGLD